VEVHAGQQGVPEGRLQHHPATLYMLSLQLAQDQGFGSFSCHQILEKITQDNFICSYLMLCNALFKKNSMHI
jgi:hypothetical protein